MTAKPYRSGHCNTSNPPEIHGQCKGSTTNKGETLPCVCACHDDPEEPEPEPGRVVDDLDEQTYHADTASVSASGMKDLLRSPAHYQHARKHPKTSNAMELGTIAHRLVLGKGAEYAVLDPNEIGVLKDGTPAASPTSTAAWRTAVEEAEAKGLIVLKPDQFAAAERMADAVLTHPVAGGLFTSPGRSELSMFWHDPAFDVVRRCRWDRLCDSGIGVDLKTSRTANPDALPKHVIEFGYDLSAAWYLAIAAGLGIEIAAYALVFVESTEPHNVVVAELSDDFLERGAALAHKALTIWRRCVDTGTWPGYVDDPITLTPPRWATTSDQIVLTIPEGTDAA